MIEKLFSHKAPLIYYSYTQLINDDNGNKLVYDANKITIRKNDDFGTNGLEFKVYSFISNNTPNLCREINQTNIVNDGNRIDFEGKGISNKGISLSNIFGCLYPRNGLTQLSTGFTDKNYMQHYFNCYKEEDPNLLKIDLEHIHDFLDSTYTLLNNKHYDPSNIWFRVRACIISYYKNKYQWYSKPFSCIFSDEWNNLDNINTESLKISLLKDFESMLDNRFYKAFQYHDSEYTFKQELYKMLNFQAIYNLLYSTLI